MADQTQTPDMVKQNEVLVDEVSAKLKHTKWRLHRLENKKEIMETELDTLRGDIADLKKEEQHLNDVIEQISRPRVLITHKTLQQYLTDNFPTPSHGFVLYQEEGHSPTVLMAINNITVSPQQDTLTINFDVVCRVYSRSGHLITHTLLFHAPIFRPIEVPVYSKYIDEGIFTKDLLSHIATVCVVGYIDMTEPFHFATHASPASIFPQHVTGIEWTMIDT